VASKYGTMLMMGMAMRVADDVLNEGQDAKIKEIRDEMHGRILETNREVERQSDIEVIPIQKLVRVQLGSGLMIAEHLKDGR